MKKALLMILDGWGIGKPDASNVHRRWSNVLLKTPLLPGLVRLLQETGFAACLFLFVLNFGPVSYTHLDVYKRQGVSSTMARRWPHNLLNSVDVPTLGRPTTATIGLLIGVPPFLL